MIRTAPAPVTLELEDRAVITGMGLSLPDDLSFDDWLKIGRKLMLADKAVQWAIGDWWASGDHRYGERAAAAIDPATGENRLQRYMDYAWVARRIETSRRHEVLSWSAHKEVAALEPDVQDNILERAVENGWGSREVRAAVKEYKDRLANGNKPRLSAQTPDVEDAEIIEEADGPVFDSTEAGVEMSAELRAENRREFKEARAERVFSTATEKLNYALGILRELRLSGTAMSEIDAARVSAEACTIEGSWLASLAPQIRHIQNTEFDSIPAVHSVSPEQGGADGFTDPQSSSAPPAQFNRQVVDGLAVEQPDEIPANLRRRG